MDGGEGEGGGDADKEMDQGQRVKVRHDWLHSGAPGWCVLEEGEEGGGERGDGVTSNFF